VHAKLPPETIFGLKTGAILACQCLSGYQGRNYEENGIRAR